MDCLEKRAVVFQPSSRGHVTVTSRSVTLYQLLRTDNPVLKILLQPLQTHAQKYGDSGLFAGLLTLNLILNGMDLDLPRHKVAMVTSYALSLVVQYLGSEKCLCRCDLQLSSVTHMMALLRTFLASKTTVCHLNNAELDHVCSLILQAFLKVVPSSSSSVSSQPFSAREKLHIQTITGRTAAHSKIIEGLLVESSAQRSLREELEWVCGRKKEEEEEEREGGGKSLVVKRDEEGMIVTAVFNISLAGDLEDYPKDLVLSLSSTHLDARGGSDGRRGMAVVRQLLQLMERLVEEEGVGLVGCQKCIHPLVKDYLQQRGVLVVERLSSIHIDSVRDVTGAQLISSFTPHGRLGDWLGRLRDIRTVSIGERSYLALLSDSVHCSLVLCCETETVADELKPLCSSGVTVLEHSLQYPYVLYGGGCTDTIICHYLLQKAEEVSEATTCDLQCNKQTYTRVMRSVAKTFSSLHKHHQWHDNEIALTDTVFHHKWVFPPGDYFQDITSSPPNERTASRTVEVARPSKTCCCGSATLSEVSALSGKWKSLCEVEGGFSALPESLVDHLRKLQGCPAVTETSFKEQTNTGDGDDRLHRHAGTAARICDDFLSRQKAVELAGDLSFSILRIASVVH